MLGEKVAVWPVIQQFLQPRNTYPPQSCTRNPNNDPKEISTNQRRISWKPKTLDPNKFRLGFATMIPLHMVHQYDWILEPLSTLRAHIQYFPRWLTCVKTLHMLYQLCHCSKLCLALWALFPWWCLDSWLLWRMVCLCAWILLDFVKEVTCALTQSAHACFHGCPDRGCCWLQPC